MRYIQKNKITHIASSPNLLPLNSFIDAQLTALPDSLHPAYDGLDAAIKRNLVNQLISEQNGLCCYCMASLEDKKYHIEHLSPQSSFKNEEVQYYNLFLSCGSEKEKKNHCGQAKKDIPLPKIISFHNPKSNEKCENYFKYNLQGEILPMQGYESIESNIKDYINLNPSTKQLLGVIEVLNLNAEILKATRRNVADAIMLLPDNPSQLESAANHFQTPDSNGFLTSMFTVAVYFLNFKLSRLRFTV